MEKNPTLISIIVPVYNEEKTIFEILNKISNLRKNEYSLQVIVIDDGSNDSSIKILKDNQHLIDKLIVNEKNKGKGYSVKKGLEIADGKYIIFQDADLEYDPNDLLKFFKLIEKFQPDLIIGSRFIYSEYTRSHSILNKFGNNFITLLFNLIYNTTFTDIYSCYACFKKNLFNFADLKTEGFE